MVEEKKNSEAANTSPQLEENPAVAVQAPDAASESARESVASESAKTVDPDAKKKAKVKKTVGWVFTGLGLAVVAFLLFVVSVLAVDKFVNKSPVPSFFGTASLIVVSDSMSGTIEKGDLIIIKKCDEYKIGDIVTFVNDGDPMVITHRIIYKDGEKYYTRGDANTSSDRVYVLEENIYGKVTGKIPYVGLFFTWLTAEFGWLYLLAGAAILASGIVLLKYFGPTKKEKKQ